MQFFVRKLTDFVLDFMLKKVYAELAQFPSKVVSQWIRWQSSDSITARDEGNFNLEIE